VIGLDTGVHDLTIRLVLERGGVEGRKTIEFHGPADITRETTDAVVNAANSSLLGGGGVDGAIHRAGGPAVLAECRQIVSKIGSLPAGKAVITTGGRLAAKHVIHTVGPIYRDGGQAEAEKLASCHRESIRLADEHALASLSFPAISTGAYGYPVSEAAPIAISSVVEALAAARHVKKVRFVLFDIATLKAYTRAAEMLGNADSASSYRIEKGPS
jgi:O-acetyl-ADP-ribose deacetylase (regulator of RNase III)